MRGTNILRRQNTNSIPIDDREEILSTMSTRECLMSAPVLLLVRGDYYHHLKQIQLTSYTLWGLMIRSIIKHCLLPMMNLFQVEQVYESRIENAAGIKNRGRCFYLSSILFVFNEQKSYEIRKPAAGIKNRRRCGKDFLKFWHPL